MTEIQKILYAHSDEKYIDYIAKSIPTLPRERFIGVRSPEYGKIVKEITGSISADDFLNTLPHVFYEENILHSALICRIKDFDDCLQKVEQFLPYIDNWAVCDGLTPGIFKKYCEKLKPKIPEWLSSDAPYIKRFAMRTVMINFLEENFAPEFLKTAAEIRSDEYYVNMMTAWLFAEALTKQWDTAIPYIEQNLLDKWTHNKAIQKAVDSYRIPSERKEYLKSLRRKK